MSTVWFFYNESKAAGVHTSVNAQKAPILGELLTDGQTTIQVYGSKFLNKTDSKLANIQYQYQLVMGDIKQLQGKGIRIIIESNNRGIWQRDSNVIKIDNVAKSLVEINAFAGTLIDGFMTQDWVQFGGVEFRVKVYVPAGQSITNFFFGLNLVSL